MSRFLLRARGVIKPHIIAVGIIAISITVLSAFSYVPIMPKAYADGLTQEHLPPASIGNRDASLFVKVNPAVLNSSTLQDAYMQFKLYDAKNNQTIQHVTYHITVTKASASSATNASGSGDQKALVDEFFHAHSGLLNLKVQPSNDQKVAIYGNKDPFQNAYVADPGGTVNVKGPVLADGGLYHFKVEIFGIDNDRNIFVSDDAPKFDSYLSVGDVSPQNIVYQGQKYNASIVSYYDQISNFKFNQDSKTISWSMPFDWDPQRLKSVNVFVHEEVRLPMSMEGFSDTNSFNGEVNGHPVTGRMLAVVPANNQVTIHYMLNKNDLIAMGQNMTGSNDTMQFSLSPGTSVVPEFPMPTILMVFGALLGTLAVTTRMIKIKR